MTREHVLPQWLLRFLDGTTGSGNATIGRAGRTISMREAVTRRVCTDCNSGWMAELEGWAKPLMLLMLENRVSLRPVDQAVLARWAMKTALTAHLAASPRSEALWLTSSAYEHFASGPVAMPSGVTVMLGAFEGEVGGPTGVEPVTFEVRRTTYSVGLPSIRVTMRVLAIVFLVHIFPGDRVMHFSIDAGVKERLLHLWPPLEHATVAEPIIWPPPATFDALNLADLAAITLLAGRAPVE